MFFIFELKFLMSEFVMIENVLERKQASLQIKFTVKSLISVGIIALAVILPQLAHFVAGEQSGVMLLPMYLPVLLGGCLLGSGWGAAIGLMSPLISWIITSFAGTPMPALARLPFMMAELAVFALIAGLFSNKISKHSWVAFPAVLLAQICGRAFFVLLVALFQNVTPFTTAKILTQIKTGLTGFAIQAVLVPLLVMGLEYLLDKDKRHD